MRETRTVKPLLKIMAIATVLVSFWIVWAVHGLQIATLIGGPTAGSNLTTAAAWGDSFGGFNALVSTLGFAAVLATLWFQSTALKDQAADLHRQRFESTIFELLRLMREVRNEVTFKNSVEYRQARQRNNETSGTTTVKMITRTGYRAINGAVLELRYWLAPGKEASLKGKSGIVFIYENHIHKNNESTLGPYFRIIYTILNKIKNDSTLSDSEKAAYGNILRSQLTSDEIILLSVSSLLPLSKDLKELIEYFRLLKYLPSSSLQRKFTRIFDTRAFESRD